MQTDDYYMQRAIDLAARAHGHTSPNPMVGCVVVKEGRIVGEAFHTAAGQAHAEVAALADAGDVADATVYVSLEPCSHHARTPPCAELLVKLKPSRVVVAMEDPNPLVSGRGLQLLRNAGIQVEVGLLEDKARQLNEVFIKYITTGLPFVIAKCGMSLDGKIATHTGDSKWITSKKSREHSHHLRQQVDAILVGSRTVRLDDPSLTTRLQGSAGRNPIRVILDGRERLGGDHKIFAEPREAPSWIVTTTSREYENADAVLNVSGEPGDVDLLELMQELGRREVTSVLIEGGGATLASAFAARIVDKVAFFIGPKIIGGHDAISAVDGVGAASLADATVLHGMQATNVGEDILIEAYVQNTL
jgi:diaminohydroxyphosphoribosylaminopyrimidine deaminase/5-amino-6-(5-phosphoribosylamino)uracil reductase